MYLGHISNILKKTSFSLNEFHRSLLLIIRKTKYGDKKRDHKANVTASGYSLDLAFWKNGQIASTPVTLYSNMDMDIGYADVLTMNGSFLVSCYIPNIIRSYEFWYDILK